MGPETVCLPSFFKTYFFYVTEKKYSNVCERHEGEQMMTTFSVFGWTIILSFKINAKAPLNSIKNGTHNSHIIFQDFRSYYNSFVCETDGNVRS